MASMTERQKECFNAGVDTAAQVHDEAATQYERLHMANDAAIHKQWAKNIRAKLLFTERPFCGYLASFCDDKSQDL